MGQIQVSGAIVAGPPTTNVGFPQMISSTPLGTTPNPKPSAVSTGTLSRNVSVVAPAFGPLQGVGPTDTVTKGDFLYLRTNAPLRIRRTHVDPSNPLLTYTTLDDVMGLLIMEFHPSAPLVLLEAQGAASIEYLISGPQLFRRIPMLPVSPNPQSTERLMDSLNRTDPTVLADMLRTLGLGSILRSLPTFVRRTSAPARDSYNLAAVFPIVDQYEDASAAQILYAYARAGTGTPGPLAVQAAGATPAAGQIAISPNGAIVTAAADVWTDLDVVYLPDKGDIVDFTGNVAAGILTLPPAITNPGAVTLLEAEALTGGAGLGKLIVLVPGAAPASGSANFNTAKSQVLVHVADAITTMRLRLLVSGSVSVNKLLEGSSTDI